MVESSYTGNKVTFCADVWVWNMSFFDEQLVRQSCVIYWVRRMFWLLLKALGTSALPQPPCLCLWHSLEDLVGYLWFSTSDEYCMCCVMMHRCLVTGWCTTILVSDEFERLLPEATLKCTSRRLLFHSTGLTCKTSSNLTKSLKDNEKCSSIDNCCPIVFFSPSACCLSSIIGLSCCGSIPDGSHRALWRSISHVEPLQFRWKREREWERVLWLQSNSGLTQLTSWAASLPTWNAWSPSRTLHYWQRPALVTHVGVTPWLVSHQCLRETGLR